MNDYLHFLLSTYIYECEDGLWRLVKSLLGRDRTEETGARINEILADFKDRADQSFREAGDSATEFQVEVTPSAELYLALALMLTQWAGKSRDAGDGEGSLSELLLAREMVGMAIMSADGEYAERELISSIARKAADKRHTENRDMKAQALEHYAANRHNYPNKDEAALALTKLVPVSFATARKWLKGQ